MAKKDGRSRYEWVQDEKGDLRDWFTSGEFRTLLGWSESRFKRGLADGRIPPTGVRAARGWKLWPPHVVNATLQRILYPGESSTNRLTSDGG